MSPAARKPSADCISGTEVRACGPVSSRLYVLGERAGKDECRQRRPFVGRAGQTLREWFHCAELDLDKYRRWNVCIDYHPKNPKPKPSEIERDRPKVVADIERCKPDVIVAVGRHATEWCLQRKVRIGDDDVHGRKFEVQIGDHKGVCMPVHHPSTYGRTDRAKKGKADVVAVARLLRGLTLMI